MSTVGDGADLPLVVPPRELIGSAAMLPFRGRGVASSSPAPRRADGNGR